MTENENEEKTECEICDHLIEVCEVFGKGKTCKEAVEEMKKGNISVDELMNMVDNNFDKDKFKQEWDRLVDEKQKGSQESGD